MSDYQQEELRTIQQTENERYRETLVPLMDESGKGFGTEKGSLSMNSLSASLQQRGTAQS